MAIIHYDVLFKKHAPTLEQLKEKLDARMGLNTHLAKDALEGGHAWPHLGMVKEVTSKWQGPQRLVGQPVQLERTPSTVARAAPRRGEHSEEILLELGVSAEDLVRMKATGVY